MAQAKRAFRVAGPLDDTKSYLVIDDVYTTGATIKYATKALYKAGARNIYVVVIARQTLD
jgi:predicted amidophosphoribosyltransferase